MSRRARLVAGMVEVAASAGYAAASPAAVSAAAGLPRSAFDGCFRGSAHCFEAAFDSIAEELVEHVAASCERRERPAQATVEALLEYATSHQVRALLVFCESLAAGDRPRGRRERLIERVSSLLEQRLEASGADGPDMPPAMLVGGVFRLIGMRLCSKRLGQMGGDLARWISMYERADGASRWRGAGDLATPRMSLAPRPDASLRVGGDEDAVLLHSLAALVFEQSYAAVGVDEVAAAAGVSRAAFYRRFKDKREALLAGAELGYETMMAAAARLYFVEDSWPDRIWRVSTAVSEFFATEPALAHLLFVELAALRLRAARVARQRMYAGALMLEGGFAANPALAAFRPRLTEAIATATLELSYAEAPRRGAQWRPDLRAQRAYVCLAPFLGAERASEFVAEKLVELDAAGRGETVPVRVAEPSAAR